MVHNVSRSLELWREICEWSVFFVKTEIMLKGERAVRQELNELDNQMSDMLNAEQKVR